MAATKSRSKAPVWLLAAGLAAMLGACGMLVWRGMQAPPNLAEIRALARERRFDEAQTLMERYLQAFPQDNQARLMMAQFAMDRLEPQPEVALEHLRRIREGTPHELAVVQFSEGKAHYQAQEYEEAEACWRRAIELDPAVPEAGWALLDLLDFEGRPREARELGMRLHVTEPDPRDRVRLLLELIRIELDKVAAGSQVQVFDSYRRKSPDNLALAIAVGSAYVRDGQAEEGIKILKEARDRHPDSVDAWDALLTGLDEGFQADELKSELAKLPPSMADDPRFAKHTGAVAQNDRDWPKAVAALRRAYEFEPYNGAVLYRLRMALRSAEDTEEFERIDQKLMAQQEAAKQLRSVYEEARGVRTLGVEKHTELCHKIAAIREQMGRYDEAAAWHRLVLQDTPDDPVSLAAVARLK